MFKTRSRCRNLLLIDTLTVAPPRIGIEAVVFDGISEEFFQFLCRPAGALWFGCGFLWALFAAANYTVFPLRGGNIARVSAALWLYASLSDVFCRASSGGGAFPQNSSNLGPCFSCLSRRKKFQIS